MVPSGLYARLYPPFLVFLFILFMYLFNLSGEAHTTTKYELPIDTNRHSLRFSPPNSLGMWNSRRKCRFLGLILPSNFCVNFVMIY